MNKIRHCITECNSFYDHLFLYVKTRKLRTSLQNYHLAHEGKKALIIGNGPSVDVNLLKQFSGITTFACNRFYMCYGMTSFRPNYTVVVDNQMLQDFGELICCNSGTPVFLNSPELAANNEQGVYLPLSNRAQFSFKNLKSSKYMHSGNSVVVSAIQLAYFMGSSSIYLYGVDHSFNVSKMNTAIDGKALGEGNHFIKNYRSNKPWYPPDTGRIEYAFQKCVEFLSKKEIPLINLTPDTQLTQVPKGNLNKFIDSNYDNC